MLENRRRAKRFAANLPVQCARLDGQQLSGTTINVSQTGARIVLRGNDHSLSSFYKVRIDNDVELTARTVWQYPMANGQCRIVGLEFETQRPEQTEQWSAFLNTRGLPAA